MSTLTIQKIEVVSLVLPILATLVTSFRLFERMRQGRLWLDDAWAALGMISIIILFVSNFLYLQDFAQYSQMTKVALYYLIAQTFYGVVWAARISILFTVVRLTIPGTFRRILFYVVGAFLVTWMVLFAQVFWTCEREPGWKTNPRPQCDLGRNVAIAQIITDVLGDLTLMVAPFWLIYRVRLSRAQKIRILAIFSTSAITTVVSLTHAYYVLSAGGLKESFAAMIEVSVGLIVANLSVVVAFLFRITTEEGSTFTAPQLKSIVTFGSQPIRNRTHKKTLIGVETTTVMLDDLATYHQDTETEFEPMVKERNAEVVTLHESVV